jgi:uncharacterized protein (TIGR02145 family)
LFNCTFLQSQESCFKIYLDAGIKSYTAGRYNEAINKFNAAKVCSDVDKKVLDEWIKNTYNKIKNESNGQTTSSPKSKAKQKFSPPKVETVIINNENYKAVQIGSQYWLAENLNVSTYRNGDLIPQVTDPDEWAKLTTGAWCYYNNDPANGIVNGKLYNWYAVNDPRGLAPQGWHIPIEKEWKVLINYLGEETAAEKLKSKDVSSDEYYVKASNSSGFAGKLGGVRNEDNSFTSINHLGLWWSSGENETGRVSNFALSSSHNGAYVSTSVYKKNAFSVRCIKGESDFPVKMTNSDKDGDGFNDYTDNCPNEFSKINNGCPLKQEVELTIDSKSFWKDMGIDMNGVTGFSIIKMNGSWSVDGKNYPKVDGWGYTNESETALKNFASLKTVKDAVFGALVVKIGDNGEPFAIMGKSFFSNPGGKLFMKINDEALADNEGALILTVEIIRTR